MSTQEGIICITSCKFCISFEGNGLVTRGDVLKMALLADPWKLKSVTLRFFAHCAAAPSVLAAPPADRDLSIRVFVARHVIPGG